MFITCILSFSVFVNSNAVEIFVHRKAQADYLQNAVSSLCHQYSNTIWNDANNRCECPLNSTFYSFPPTFPGCFVGNEPENDCQLRLSASSKPIHFIPLSDNPSRAIQYLGSFTDPSQIDSCVKGISNKVQKWTIDGWKPGDGKIGAKLKATKLVVSFVTADFQAEVQGQLLKIVFDCTADKPKCVLLKVEGRTKVISVVVIPTTPTTPTTTTTPTTPITTTQQPNTTTKILPKGGQQNDEDDDTIAYVLGAVVAILCVIILAGTFFYIKRKREKNSLSETATTEKKKRKKNSSKRRSCGGEENFYEDINTGVYAAIADGDTYLDPIETIKRSYDQSYQVMLDRKSYNPNSNNNTAKFDVNQPTPSIPPRILHETKSERKHSYISTTDAEKSKVDDRYSSLDETAFNGNTNTGYSTLCETATIKPDDSTTKLNEEFESAYEFDDYDTVEENQVLDDDGFYDHVGAISPNNSVYDPVAI